MFYGFQVLPTEAQDPSASGRMLCAHPALDQAGSISQFPSVPHLAHIELLAPDLCQLGRKPHCTSLVPAFRCCRLTHPHTIMLTCSWFAQTRAGIAWRKTLLVSSSWLIASGYEVKKTDTQTSYSELQLCFTSAGTEVPSHPCNCAHSSHSFTLMGNLVSYITHFSRFPVIQDSFFFHVLAP